MKSGGRVTMVGANMSLPARGVWIEIVMIPCDRSAAGSLPARGGWIEILSIAA